MNLDTTKPASPLLAIAPGPTRILRSSAPSSWRGILLEKHFTSPGERTSARTERHVITMLASPSRFWYRTMSASLVECLHRPGTIMIAPAGLVPDIRLHTPTEFIHCALEEEFIHAVAEESGCRQLATLVFRPGIQDKPIRHILSLLMEQLETDRPLGRLYIDSLALALATRYVTLDCGSGAKPESRVSPLPQRILSRVQERIAANLDADLSLDSLAAESGYSRAHFLRMFRAATGLTPHQYVLDLRLRRAQEYLRQKRASIIDVAISCGFSSQSHMTSVFRQRLEMTPGEFRRET